MPQPISQIQNADGTATVMFDDGSTRTMAPSAAGGMLATVPIAGQPDVIPAAAPAATPAPQEAPPPAWLAGPAMAGGIRSMPTPQAVRNEVAAGDAKAAEEDARAKAAYDERMRTHVQEGQQIPNANPQAILDNVPEAERNGVIAAPRAPMTQGPVVDDSAPAQPQQQQDWSAALPSGSGGGGVRRIAAHFADAGGQRTIYSPDTKASHDSSLAEQAAGGREFAQRLYQIADAEAEAYAGLRQDIAAQEQRAQDLARRRDEEVAKAQRDIETTARDIAATKIDPKHAWADAGAGAQIAAALGVMLTQYGMAIARQGGPNPALQIINKTIDDDVAAQVANLNNKQRGLENQRSLYAQMLAKYGDEGAAINATKAALYESTKLKATELASKRKGAEAEKSYSDLMAGLQDKQTAYLAETQGIIKQAYQPERVVALGGGLTPVQMIARRAAQASGGDPRRAAAIAFDLARANGMSEKVANDAGSIAASGVSLARGVSSQEVMGDYKAETEARRKAYETGLVKGAEGRAEGPKVDKDIEKRIAALVKAQGNLEAMSQAAGGWADRARRSSPGIGQIKTQADQEYVINRGMLLANLKHGLNVRQVPDELLPGESAPGAATIPQMMAGTGKLGLLKKRIETEIAALRDQQNHGGMATGGGRESVGFQEAQSWQRAPDAEDDGGSDK